MISVYEERGIEKGREEMKPLLSLYEERGVEKGREKGGERGLLGASRANFLKILRHNFGQLPESAPARIDEAASATELDAWFDRALDAATLEEVGIIEAV